MPPKPPRSRRRRGDRPKPTPPALKDRLLGALILFVIAEVAMALGYARASRRSDRSVDFWIAGAVICGLAGAAAGFWLGDRFKSPKRRWEDFQERQRRRRGD